MSYLLNFRKRNYFYVKSSAIYILAIKHVLTLCEPNEYICILHLDHEPLVYNHCFDHYFQIKGGYFKKTQIELDIFINVSDNSKCLTETRF